MSAIEEPAPNEKWVGQALRRKEDPRMITGRGPLRGRHGRPGHALHGRRPLARGARQDRLDRRLRRRASSPASHGVFTGEDLDIASGLPMAWVPPGVEIKTPEHWPLAKGEVKYVGQGVAIVLGDDKYAGRRRRRAGARRVRPAAGRRRSREGARGRRDARPPRPRHQPDARVVDRRRRHGRGLGRGRRRDRAADRQPPHRRRADRAARAASPTTAAASSRCTSRARTRT